MSAGLEKDCRASYILPANCCSMATPYRCTTSRDAAVKVPLAAWSWTDSGVVSPSALRIGAASLGMANDTWSLLRSEEHTSELQSHLNLVCRLLLEKKKKYSGAPGCVPALSSSQSGFTWHPPWGFSFCYVTRHSSGHAAASQDVRTQYPCIAMSGQN